VAYQFTPKIMLEGLMYLFAANGVVML